MNFKCLISLLVSILFISEGNAQLCTGNFGNPVVKLDFGSGTSSHGSALGMEELPSTGYCFKIL